MKNKFSPRKTAVLVFALLIAVLGPFLAIPAEALMGPITLENFSEYEAYFETRNPQIPLNFVGYEMISCLGEFDAFRFGLKEGDTPEMHPNYVNDYSQWEYIFVNGNSLRISSSKRDFSEPIVTPADGMRDMRSIERKDNCRVQSNGLEYQYSNGVLTVIYWEYAQLQFAFSFDYDLVETENGYEITRTEEIDMSHPVIGKLLSRNEQDVKDGLNLLKAHMYKNGFVNLSLIVWIGIALIAIAAVTTFFVIRHRRKKKKAVSDGPDELFPCDNDTSR